MNTYRHQSNRGRLDCCHRQWELICRCTNMRYLLLSECGVGHVLTGPSPEGQPRPMATSLWQALRQFVFHLLHNIQTSTHLLGSDHGAMYRPSVGRTSRVQQLIPKPSARRGVRPHAARLHSCKEECHPSCHEPGDRATHALIYHKMYQQTPPTSVVHCFALSWDFSGRSIQRPPPIPHSRLRWVHEVLVLCLLAMIHARNFRGLLEVTDISKGVHASLAGFCFVLRQEIPALEDIVVAAAQHAARLHLGLRDVDIEPASSAAYMNSCELPAGC
jgi:hypothetical protein